MVNKEKIQEAVRYMVKKTERELQCEARLSELQSLRKEVEGMKNPMTLFVESSNDPQKGLGMKLAYNKVLSLLDERIKKLS